MGSRADGSSRSWQRDHPWARVYDKISRDSRLGSLLWRVGVGSDLSRLHRSAHAELARLSHGSTVLDLPCGGGNVLRNIDPGHELHYLAADISGSMLERTQAEADRLGRSGIKTVAMDAAALPLASASVDLVLAFTSLHCFPDPRAAVGEYGRVLRPGGRLALSTLTTDCPWPWRAIWPLGRAAGVLGPGCTHGQLRAWLVEAELVDVELEPAGALVYVTASRRAH